MDSKLDLGAQCRLEISRKHIPRELSRVHELQLVKTLVGGRDAQQLLVRTDGGDATIFDDGDTGGAADSRQAMGDDEDCAAGNQIGKRDLDQGLTLRVQRGSGLIENENGRVL